jgi:hypothetical protein
MISAQAINRASSVRAILYENEDLKAGRIPTVIPIDQVRDEGNCGEVTNRGEEACECAVKLTIERRRQPHSRQGCEVSCNTLCRRVFTEFVTTDF